MQKITWRSGLGILALGALLAWPVFDNPFISSAPQQTLAANLLEVAQAAQALPGTPELRRKAAVKAIHARVVQGLEAGATKDDIAQAIQAARNDPTASPATASVLGEAQKDVATASTDVAAGPSDDAPGAIGSNPGAALLAAPVAPAAGAGYRPG